MASRHRRWRNSDSNREDSIMCSMKALGVVLTLLATASLPALGQIAVSANDGKAILDNGVTKVIAGVPDTVAVIDLGANPPKLLAESKRRPASWVRRCRSRSRPTRATRSLPRQ